jgi:hypothetical protein
MRDTGKIIPDHIRRLARSTMHHVMGQFCHPIAARGLGNQRRHRRAPLLVTVQR